MVLRGNSGGFIIRKSSHNLYSIKLGLENLLLINFQ